MLIRLDYTGRLTPPPTHSMNITIAAMAAISKSYFWPLVDSWYADATIKWV